MQGKTIQSFSHSVIQSLSHSVTQSFSHSVTQSFSHSVILSFYHHSRSQVIRYSEKERCPLAQRGFKPDMATVKLNYFFDDAKADAGAFIHFTGMQSLEDEEYPVGILWVDAYAVIFHGK